MKESEARALKIGDRVTFIDDEVPTDENGFLGTVTERDYVRFMVKWDDGVVCSYHNALVKTLHRVKNA